MNVKNSVSQLKYYTIAIKFWYNYIIQQSLLIKDNNKICLSKFAEFNSFVSA